MLPPSILKFDASAIPVGNLVISSNSRDDKFLLDIADHQLRDELASVEGLAAAPVFGGVFRQVQIFVHPKTLEALKLSPMDVSRIVNNQSQVIPTGEMRIGEQNYMVTSNSMVDATKAFEKIPLYAEGRKVVYLGDVANVLDATRWRTNTVLVDGRRAVYMPLLRQAGASAITVVDNVKAFLPEMHKRGIVPDDVKLEVVFDQSQYVRDAMSNLRLEGILGAGLASLVVLLFLGNLRSTWIVAVTIPLSVLAAFVGLYFTGHTLNIMTLGGLALILGRLVDDSIVDVENTIRHMNLGLPALEAARESAREISLPIFLATLTTVVVFFPLTLMVGVGKYLFTPLAVSASLAMGASYVVSRTVSPLLCSQFLRPHEESEIFPKRLYTYAIPATAVGLGLPALAFFGAGLADRLGYETVGDALAWPWEALPLTVQWLLLAIGIAGGVVLVVGIVFSIAPAFQRFFEMLLRSYEWALRLCLNRRRIVVGLVVLSLVPAAWCFTRIGQELFPEVDSSEFTVHVRATGGPKVETTEKKVQIMEKAIRDVIPERDLELTTANIGISSRWSAVYTSNNGPHSAFVQVQLRSGFAGRRRATLAYVERLRQRLAKDLPSDDFFFETGGMIRRILNAGALAPIEVQVHGRDMASRRAVAKALERRIIRIPQVQETYLPQAMDLPVLKINVDRTAAARLNLTQTDVVRNVIAALMSSAQLAPNFWIDPTSGNPYFIGVQYPEHIVENIETLENIPVTSEKMKASKRAPVLREVATLERTQGPVEAYHYDADRISQLFVSVGDQDIGRVAGEIDRIVAQLPFQYALMKIPEESLISYAREGFRDKTDVVEDEELHKLLEEYFRDEDPETADKIRDRYHVDIEEFHAGRSEEFKELLQAYVDKGRAADRKAMLHKFHIDPEPLRLPKGVRVTVRGEVTSMRESFGEMGFNLLLAVLLVYLVMTAQFSSWLDPLIMIVAAPLGLIGVVVTLWLTGTSLNVQSLMGVLLMLGISVSNSVLLVEFANRLRAEGKSTYDAIVQAARTRLRPILMTTVATIMGLLPMAIHLHPGDEMNLPLARAVIGGLAGSTLLTLFVVPVLYVLLKPKSANVPPQQPAV
jgi:multidrug efflux pump subunit AcrB